MRSLNVFGEFGSSKFTNFSNSEKIKEKIEEEKKKKEKEEKKQTSEIVTQTFANFDQTPVYNEDGEIKTKKVEVRVKPSDEKEETDDKPIEMKPNLIIKHKTIEVPVTRKLTKNDMLRRKNKRIAKKLLQDNSDMIAAGVKFSAMIL